MEVKGAKISTLPGLKQTRNYSIQFLVGRLNHLSTVYNTWYIYPWWEYNPQARGLLEPRSNELSYTDSI